MRAPNRSPIESKERPENRTVDLLGTFFCAQCSSRGALVRIALAYDTLALIISFWLQLTRERPYRQATCHHSGTTSFVTRKGIHVES